MVEKTFSLINLNYEKKCFTFALKYEETFSQTMLWYISVNEIEFPYEKKVLASIGSNTFFAITYCKFTKKVLDPILTNSFFSYGFTVCPKSS